MSLPYGQYWTDVDAKDSGVCYGCHYCVERRAPWLIGYFCIAKSKTGRAIYKIKNTERLTNRDLLIAGLNQRIRKHIPPKWCPKKKGEN